MINIEVTEEKLFRLLQHACEKTSNFTDSTKIMTIARSNELEILNQRNFKTITFPVFSSFNLHKVSKYTEVVTLEEAQEIADKNPKELRKIAVLLNQKEFEGLADNSIILLKSRLIITHDFDMQTFQE